MSIKYSGITAAILLLLGSAPTSAQRAPAARVYDLATVETISGRIVRLENVPSRGLAEGGVHARVRTATETIPVHLGPGWYLHTQTLTLRAGDSVTVRGSRITIGGNPAIAAATVRRGNEQLVLRDSTGVPLWSAGPNGDPRRP